MLTDLRCYLPSAGSWWALWLPGIRWDLPTKPKGPVNSPFLPQKHPEPSSGGWSQALAWGLLDSKATRSRES